MAYLDGLVADERRRLVDELNESDRAPDRAVGPALDAYLAALVGGSQRSRLGRVPVKIIAGVRKDDAVGGIDGWIRQVGLE